MKRLRTNINLVLIQKNSELDELYELDNNIEMNKTMQQDSLEELHIAKTSHPTTTTKGNYRSSNKNHVI